MNDLVSRLRERARDELNVPEDQLRVIRAPYRFCPVGAHVDHQDGRVTGFALDRALYLAYAPDPGGRVRLQSLDTHGEVRASLTGVGAAVEGDWGNYVRGAVRALASYAPISRGITGVVGGEMSSGGVSSSAALGVALLMALEDANDLEVDTATNIALDRAIENDYLGLQNGILDQSVILRAREDSLMHLDCRTGAVSFHEGPPASDVAFVAVHSGVTESLITTGFNRRVQECRTAASVLLEAVGRDPGPEPRLRDVPHALFDLHNGMLEIEPRRRARHFFEEMDRVVRAVYAWEAGDLAAFGAVISETGRSSIDNYECGAPELTCLYELMTADRDVLGARFSGAGFRGYAMALVRPDDADAVAERLLARYLETFPDRKKGAHTHVCRPANGAGFVS